MNVWRWQVVRDRSCPRLIEVALPIREISAESVRDKSLRHGHISTLHLWWARRPLPASRAVVFASLVPDPDDPRCPKEFRDAVEHNLKTHVPSVLKAYKKGRNVISDEDPYRPYEDLPDTLRNRLLAFIAKWSPEALAFELGKGAREPKPAQLLDVRSLVKWESSNPENIQGQEVLGIARKLVIIAYGGSAPIVLDPFAGGGAIPLEAGRLGCQPIANDYNPVAYLILRGTCEFPQKYGKPGKRKIMVEEFGHNFERDIEVPNVLVHDVEKWAKWILQRSKAKIGHLYPPGKDGRPIVGYLWARTVPCANPICRAVIPMLRSLVICNLRNKSKRISLIMNKREKEIVFSINANKDIQDTSGTMIKGGHCKCPFCQQITTVDAVRNAAQAGQMGERIVAVIIETPDGSKSYRQVQDIDLKIYREAEQLATNDKPQELMPHFRNINLDLYGLLFWGDIFNARQIAVMQAFVKAVKEAEIKINQDIYSNEYVEALTTYLGLILDRYLQRMSSVGVWHIGQETFEHPFGRQAIPMVWDYPEANPFSIFAQKVFSSSWMTQFIKHESAPEGVDFLPTKVLFGDAARASYFENQIHAIITDPPYFDSIAYADISDYFYVWLKRALGDSFPSVFATPLTPKSNEATALPHRHANDTKTADMHFQEKLSKSFKQAHNMLVRNGLVTVMFAHQSTHAWTALIKSVFRAGLTVVSTWPLDTEKTYALKTTQSVLASSITVSCRPRIAGSAASLKDVRKEIHQVVQEAVKRFWSYGFRGADLIVACYGPAVGVFGKYERVEKADGTSVEIPELLELARKAARDAIAGEFRGDNLSTLYYVWANLYGATEQAWDDARLVVQIGGESDNAMEMDHRHTIFIVNGSKCRLALLNDRADRRDLGLDQNPPLIDSLHRSMLLWKEEKRSELVAYLKDRDLLEDGPFWNLAQALFEVLPRDSEDWKLVKTLLGERQTFRAEARALSPKGKQMDLFTD